MKRASKSLVAGVLSIVAGGVAVILGSGLIISLRIVHAFMTPPGWFDAALSYPTVPFMVLGTFAVIGGIHALMRRIWGLALAGAIAAFLVSPIVGLFAIIFTAMAKEEFRR